MSVDNRQNTTAEPWTSETGETARSEPQQLFHDGHGHVIAVRRLTAERRGRRRDVVGAALFTIIDNRIASVEIFEQDLDETDQFWT